MMLMSVAGQAVAGDPSGRWEGQARVPGLPLPIVLDLAPGAGSTWVGSVTLPGRGIKGLPLLALKVDADRVEASLAAAFGGAAAPPATLSLQLQSDGRAAGDFQQGGHRAELTLIRTGAAQVDLPHRGTPIDARLAGIWTGRYELGGAPRDVRLILVQPSSETASGELTIVGRRTTQLTLDRVIQGARWLELESDAAGIRIEGRWNADSSVIEGSFTQGPFEAPLTLRRQPAGSAR
jgi:hypothetical protein